MQISVIIPYYNCGDFIVDAVNSVLNQTLRPQEIIIVDDGSDQADADLLAQFEDPVHVIHLGENRGISHARNIGAQQAECEWLAFLDADDLWMPDKLSCQKQFLEAHPDVNVCHTGVEVFSGDRITSQHNDKPAWLNLKDALMIAQVLPSAMMINKSVFEAVGMFDTNTPGSSDRELTIRLLNEKQKIGFVNKILTRLRREGHGNISSKWKPKLLGHLYIFKKYFNLYRQHKLVRPYLRWTFQHASNNSTGITRGLFYCCTKIF